MSSFVPASAPTSTLAPGHTLAALAVAVACAAVFAPAAVAATPAYRVVDLDTRPTGAVTRPSQINDLGMVAGETTNHSHDSRGVAFLEWHHRVDTLAQDQPGHFTHGSGVNASGLVVGYEASHRGGSYESWPLLWFRDGTRLRLSGVGEANAVNDAGVVVGDLQLTGVTTRHAFMWRDGVTTDLGSAGGFTWSGANAINPAGDVAGWVGSGWFPETQAMVRLDGTMVVLGSFGTHGATATGINASRVVCGTVADSMDGPYHGFVWEASGPSVVRIDEPAGTRSLEAHALNDAGTVVGSMKVPASPNGGIVDRAFVWRDGVTADLNDLLEPADADRWVLEDATSINDHGQIVGKGHLRATHETRAFLLLPIR